ncbi:hypothetical protein HY489_02060 [Candidatus Woesearchaeota archaeon]|nr:hypothetical protein [Candidatus Woesearchaeota archaeon]
MKRLLLVLVIAVALLVLPWTARLASGASTLPGFESYYHVRMAKMLAFGLPSADEAVVPSRSFVPSPFHVLLAGVFILGGERSLVFVPLLFAVLCVLLFWLLIRRLGLSVEQQFWALLAFVLSPPLIAAAFFITPHAFVLFLLLSGWLLLEGRWWWLALAFFVIAGLSGLVFLIAAAGVLLFSLLVRRSSADRANIVLVLLLVLFLTGWYVPAVKSDTGVSEFVSDFGGVYGLSVFALLLSFIGAVVLWEYKRAYFGGFVTLLCLLVGSFFFPGLLVFANAVVCVLSGVALAWLSEHKWHLESIRQASLLVLFCGLLFSGVAHGFEIARSAPSQNFFDVLPVVPGVVLTHEKYGFWLEYAGHRVLGDLLSYDRETERDMDSLFFSTDVEWTLVLLDKYDVSYVLITPEMKQGLVWDRDEQGLAFLVANSEMFKRTDGGSSIGVWERQ